MTDRNKTPEEISSEDSLEDSEEEITNVLREDGEENELQKKYKEIEEKYLRLYADFENHKKRVAREREEIAQAVSERLLRELLEVKDHLELALSHAQTTEAKTLKEGVELTLKQLNQVLKKFGVEEIQALGEAFNPAFHEAIQQEESVEHRPDSVARVYQKGYLFNGKLLRPSRVAVAASRRDGA